MEQGFLYPWQAPEEWKCDLCGVVGIEHLERGDAYHVCDTCGCCYDRVVADDRDYNCYARGISAPSERTVFNKKKTDKFGKVIKTRVSYGVEPARRYKRVFHYRERLAQWSCAEPKIIDPRVMPMFKAAARTGYYGPKTSFTRGTIMQMCRELRLTRYKENWKSILETLRGEPLPKPSTWLLEYCERAFKMISDRLHTVTETGVIWGARGAIRHNMLHLNYVHRKILENIDVYDWHNEFPLLRTASKVHALDDALEQIFYQLGFKFNRTAVVVHPKCRKRAKNWQMF